MKLVFLFGPPGVGKLTVARELERLTGYKVFHNHLTVDFLQEMFAFGSPEFNSLRESIWLSVFESACRSGVAGLIFTFAPENTVRQSFIEDTITRVEAAGGEVLFVELSCSYDELSRRVELPSRKEFRKLDSAKMLAKLRDDGVLAHPKLPPPHLRIDTEANAPADSAALIASACAKKRTSPA